MKKYIFIVILLVIPHSVFAASYEFRQKSETFVLGQPIEVSLYLKVPEGPINTFNAIVKYDNSFFDSVKVSDGGSIVGAWIEQPVVKEGTVTFSALVPGGASEGKMLTLNMVAKKTGITQLKVASGTVYLNDGTATSVKITPETTDIKIVEADTAQTQQVVKQDIDTTIPDSFSVQIARDPKIFNNAWFVAFAAQDSQSGIAYYEVAESFHGNGDDLVWEKTQSPYILKNQKRNQYVYVKAVDNSGNFRIQIVEPLKTSKIYLVKDVFYGIILLILICCIWFLRRVRLKQNGESK